MITYNQGLLGWGPPPVSLPVPRSPHLLGYFLLHMELLEDALTGKRTNGQTNQCRSCACSAAVLDVFPLLGILLLLAML